MTAAKFHIPGYPIITGHEIMRRIHAFGRVRTEFAADETIAACNHLQPASRTAPA
jgi:hypothetical protein